MSDLKGKIIEVMKDGRWRTIDDVANKLKYNRRAVKSELYKMGYNKEIVATQFKEITAYRLPMPEAAE